MAFPDPPQCTAACFRPNASTAGANCTFDISLEMAAKSKFTPDAKWPYPILNSTEFASLLHKETKVMMGRAKVTKEEKRRNEMFRKRKGSLLRKANELGALTGADVYVVILRDGQYTTYKSKDQNWPVPEQQLVP